MCNILFIDIHFVEQPNDTITVLEGVGVITRHCPGKEPVHSERTRESSRNQAYISSCLTKCSYTNLKGTGYQSNVSRCMKSSIVIV